MVIRQNINECVNPKFMQEELSVFKLQFRYNLRSMKTVTIYKKKKSDLKSIAITKEQFVNAHCKLLMITCDLILTI